MKSILILFFLLLISLAAPAVGMACSAHCSGDNCPVADSGNDKPVVG